MITPRSLPSPLALTLLLLPLSCLNQDPPEGAAKTPEDTGEPDAAGHTGGDDTDLTERDTGDTGGSAGDGSETDSGTPEGGDSGGTPGGGSGGVGSCDAWDAPVVIAEVSDGGLAELSDLVPSRANPGVLWGHNDSGGDPVLYAIEGATGDLLGTLTVEGVRNGDWEDLAVAACPEALPDGRGDCLFVGEVGDNGLSRDDVAVLAVAEPLLDPPGGGPFDLSAAPTTYRFAYPDGRNNVEGLGIGPDGLPVLVTKRVDATADVYRFPTMDASRTVTVDLVARIDTGDPADEHAAEATGADVSPDGTRLLVRTYDHLLEYPLVNGVPGLPVSLPAPDEPQGEAAAYDPVSGGIWLTSEGAHQPLWFVACLAPRGRGAH
ncbi:MAG: hypothetical protein Q8P18_34030 [Pseudomonadota bacterium]|nr:hypothetical protein [Pseudomonadota bacterium]